jgi:CheY-like chemotaxis protein
MAKILVIDDDQSIVNMLATLLSQKGHSVSTAGDGKSGLAAARQDKPDLIILDLMMPVMDGFTACGILFQDPVMRLIPVIILTALNDKRDAFELLPNVRIYMTKPFDPKTLLHNIQTLIEFQKSA